VGFPTAQVAARELLGLGEEVEVLSPGPVRQELAAIGQRLAERYRSD
jgi:predicted DNA-binding transcriptional regulator YafY